MAGGGGFGRGPGPTRSRGWSRPSARERAQARIALLKTRKHASKLASKPAGTQANPQALAACLCIPSRSFHPSRFAVRDPPHPPSHTRVFATAISGPARRPPAVAAGPVRALASAHKRALRRHASTPAGTQAHPQARKHTRRYSRPAFAFLPAPSIALRCETHPIHRPTPGFSLQRSAARLAVPVSRLGLAPAESPPHGSTRPAPDQGGVPTARPRPSALRRPSSPGSKLGGGPAPWALAWPATQLGGSPLPWRLGRPT